MTGPNDTVSIDTGFSEKKEFIDGGDAMRPHEKKNIYISSIIKIHIFVCTHG